MKNADPIQEVVTYLIEGRSTATVLEFLRENPITADDAGLIVEQALAAFSKAAGMPRAVRRGWCIEALRGLYKKLITSGDYAGAIRAVKEIATLAGLYEHGDDTNQTKGEINDYIDNVLAL